jgi:hypothetical protein
MRSLHSATLRVSSTCAFLIGAPKERKMKNFAWMLLMLAILALQGFAQEHYTEGPVWRVNTIRVKPGHLDDYLSALRQGVKPFWDEAKRQGVILDWKVFLKETKDSPNDWDIVLAQLYQNHAQMDGQAAKLEAIRDKVLGGKKAATEANMKREEIREATSSELVQEITLK